VRWVVKSASKKIEKKDKLKDVKEAEKWVVMTAVKKVKTKVVRWDPSWAVTMVERTAGG